MTHHVEHTVETGWRTADPTLLIGRKSPIRQAIWNWLRGNEPAWQKSIADSARLDHDVVRQRVTDLAKDGDIDGGPHGYIAVNPES